MPFRENGAGDGSIAFEFDGRGGRGGATEEQEQANTLSEHGRTVAVFTGMTRLEGRYFIEFDFEDTMGGGPRCGRGGFAAQGDFGQALRAKALRCVLRQRLPALLANSDGVQNGSFV